MQLIADALACVRGGRRLYDGLSFSLAAGEMLGLSGPNGSGKTSLLRQIAGLLPLDAGSVALMGSESVSEEAHFLGHAAGVKEGLTLRENLEFWMRLYGRPGIPLDAALERLHLRALESVPARVLSAGQRRRLALARLLVTERMLWLLDEPDTALDAEGRETLLGILTEHRAKGGIAVVASHGTIDLKPSREISLATLSRTEAA